jgi:hypothetical protein
LDKILAPESSEKLVFVSNQHNAGNDGIVFISKSFAIFIPNHVVPVCGKDIHHVAITSFLQVNVSCSVCN